MAIEISFWLILFLSWFIYLLPNGLLKKFLLVLSPATLVSLGVWQSETVYIFGGAVLGLSHARFLMDRYGPDRMKRILKRTWLLLILITALLALLQWLLQIKPSWSFSLAALLWLAIGIKALATAVLRTMRNRYRRPKGEKPVTGKLPTVTLAIPARNETHVLTDCLRSAVSSNYPKLEIIVLDDCSQDSTPQIIKSFAHDGVRFVSGTTPASGWIGKNQAYQTLLDEASGELIIFAGVDARFNPDSIGLIVEKFASNEADLLSIMPYRDHFDLLPSLSRTLRYYFQLSFSRTPVMNSVWAADRRWLVSAGGFEPLRHEILPERKLARLARGADSYAFVLSTPSLGVSSRKRALSQFETAIRTLYPQSAKDPLMTVLWAAVWFSGASLLLYGLMASVPVLAIGAAAMLGSYITVEFALQPRGWPISGLMLPLAMLSQGVLAIASMVSYEFGQVDWKGRNVCLPVMNQLARAATYPPKNRRSSGR